MKNYYNVSPISRLTHVGEDDVPPVSYEDDCIELSSDNIDLNNTTYDRESTNIADDSDSGSEVSTVSNISTDQSTSDWSQLYVNSDFVDFLQKFTEEERKILIANFIILQKVQSKYTEDCLRIENEFINFVKIASIGAFASLRYKTSTKNRHLKQDSALNLRKGLGHKSILDGLKKDLHKLGHVDTLDRSEVFNLYMRTYPIFRIYQKRTDITKAIKYGREVFEEDEKNLKVIAKISKRRLNSYVKDQVKAIEIEERFERRANDTFENSVKDILINSRAWTTNSTIFYRPGNHIHSKIQRPAILLSPTSGKSSLFDDSLSLNKSRKSRFSFYRFGFR